MKLTQLGLDDSIEACWANLRPIVLSAEDRGSLLMIDMESHRYVDATLELTARAQAAYPKVGVAIQAACAAARRTCSRWRPARGSGS